MNIRVANVEKIYWFQHNPKSSHGEFTYSKKSSFSKVLQIQDDNGNWINIPEVNITDDETLGAKTYKEYIEKSSNK